MMKKEASKRGIYIWAVLFGLALIVSSVNWFKSQQKAEDLFELQKENAKITQQRANAQAAGNTNPKLFAEMEQQQRKNQISMLEGQIAMQRNSMFISLSMIAMVIFGIGLIASFVIWKRKKGKYDPAALIDDIGKSDAL